MCDHRNVNVEHCEVDGITPVGVEVEYCTDCGSITEVF